MSKTGSHQIVHVRTSKKGKKFRAGKKTTKEGSPIYRPHVMPKVSSLKPSGIEYEQRKQSRMSVSAQKDKDGYYELTLPYTGYFVDLIDSYDNLLTKKVYSTEGEGENQQHYVETLGKYKIHDDGKAITLFYHKKGLLNTIKKQITSFLKFKAATDAAAKVRKNASAQELLKARDKFDKTSVLNRQMNETEYQDSEGRFLAKGNTNIRHSAAAVHKTELYHDRRDKLAEKTEAKLVSRKLKPVSKVTKYKKIRRSTFHPHINK